MRASCGSNYAGCAVWRRSALRVLATELAAFDLRVAVVETEIVARTKADAVARRLATIPGIGPIIASRITATVPDPSIFRSARDFAAWIGLVPRQNSTGGNPVSAASPNAATAVSGACSSVAPWRRCSAKAVQNDPWLYQLRARKPTMVAAVALANKIARTVWAVMRHDENWRPAAGSPRRAARRASSPRLR
jgi:transposase